MSDNEKETQVAEETQNTQAAAESNNEDRKSRRGQRGEGRRGERRNRREESHENEMLDRVVTINRVSKTHKGGRSPVRSRLQSPRVSWMPRSTCSPCRASRAPSPTR